MDIRGFAGILLLAVFFEEVVKMANTCSFFLESFEHVVCFVDCEGVIWLLAVVFRIHICFRYGLLVLWMIWDFRGLNGVL